MVPAHADLGRLAQPDARVLQSDSDSAAGRVARALPSPAERASGSGTGRSSGFGFLPAARADAAVSQACSQELLTPAYVGMDLFCPVSPPPTPSGPGWNIFQRMTASAPPTTVAGYSRGPGAPGIAPPSPEARGDSGTPGIRGRAGRVLRVRSTCCCTCSAKSRSTSPTSRSRGSPTSSSRRSSSSGSTRPPTISRWRAGWFGSRRRCCCRAARKARRGKIRAPSWCAGCSSTSRSRRSRTGWRRAADRRALRFARGYLPPPPELPPPPLTLDLLDLLAAVERVIAAILHPVMHRVVARPLDVEGATLRRRRRCSPSGKNSSGPRPSGPRRRSSDVLSLLLALLELARRGQCFMLQPALFAPLVIRRESARPAA